MKIIVKAMTLASVLAGAGFVSVRADDSPLYVPMHQIAPLERGHGQGAPAPYYYGGGYVPEEEGVVSGAMPEVHPGYEGEDAGGAYGDPDEMIVSCDGFPAGAEPADCVSDSVQPPEWDNLQCEFPEWVGRPVDEVAIKETGRPYRVLPPGSMATMDYSPQRLNIHTDDNGIVVSVTCG